MPLGFTPQARRAVSNELKLIKFSTWSSFGYKRLVIRSDAGGVHSRGRHGLAYDQTRLCGNQIAVYLDGIQRLTFADAEAPAYSTGGASVDMWTDAASYQMLAMT